MMKAYITIPKGTVYDTFITPAALAEWKTFCEIEENPLDHNMSGEEVITYAKDAEILIAGWGCCPFPKEVLDQLPNLKLIAYTGGGSDHLYPDGALFKSGVKLVSGNEYFAMSVAEACLCYTICALRKIGQYYTEIKQSGWYTSEWSNRGLFGKKVGIVSYGTIAKYFCEYIRPFTDDILVYSRSMSEEEASEKGFKKASLEEIFSTCDVVSIHTALLPQTEGFITKELMSLMKQDAVFVNTARGAVVDEVAMIELIREGRIYAAIDVYSLEAPLSGPLTELQTLDRAFIMPHMGGPTIDMRGHLTKQLAKEVRNYLENGTPMMSEVKPRR